MDLYDRIQLGSDRPVEDPVKRQEREKIRAKTIKAQEESSILLPPPQRPDGSSIEFDPKTGKTKPRPAMSQKTFNPVEEIKNSIKQVMDPIDQGLENFIDNAAEAVLGRPKKESQRRRQEGRQRLAEADKALKEDVTGEIIRVPLGAGARAIEGVLSTAALGVDYTMQNLGINKDPRRNPYDLDRFERAVFDTGFSKPTTELGRGLQNLAAFAVTMSKAAGALKAAGAGGALTLGTGKLTGTGFATKLAKKAAPSLVPGAIADFLLATDGNISNMLREWAPEGLKDAFILAINEDDHPFIAGAKSAAEGMPAGVVVDAGLLLARAVRATRFWKGKGLSDTEAVTKGLEEFQQLKLELDDSYNKNVVEESQRWAQDQSNRMQEYLTRERTLVEQIQQREALEKSVQQQTIPGLEEPSTKIDEDFLRLGKQVEIEGSVDIRDPEQIEAIRNDKRFTIEELETGDGVKITGFTDEGWKELNTPKTPGALDESPELQSLRGELEEVQALQNRLDDEITRGYNPDSANLEPWERNASVRPDNPNTVAIDQLRGSSAGSIPPPKDVPLFRGGDGLITDAQWRLLGVEGQPLRLLKSIEQRMDLQEIARGARMPDAEVYKQSADILKRMLEQFNLNPNAAVFDAISKAGGTKDDGILTRPGVVAMRAFLQQTAEELHQISTLSHLNNVAGRVNANDTDRIVDRVVGIIEMMKLAQAEYGGGLRSFGLPLERLTEGGEVAERMFNRAGQSSDDLSMAAVRRWAKRISDLSRSGDPKGQQQFRQLVDALILSGGDPVAQVGFFRLASKLSGKALMQGYYNSIFSGPATSQAIGLTNIATGIIRPAAIALGGAARGDVDTVKLAIAGYVGIWDALRPGFKVLKESFRTGDSITGNARVTEQKAAMQASIDVLRTAAKGNPIKEFTAKFLDWQLNITNNPFMTWPTRTIGALDSMHKYVTARSDIQIESWKEALTEARSAGEAPEALVQRYLSANAKKIDPATGRILDPVLAQIVDDAAMQGDPGPLANTFAKLIDTIPGGRLIIPVIRSVGEMQKYAAYATPGVSTYMRRHIGLYQKVQSGIASEAEIRMFDEYRGREAIGSMIMAGGAMAVLNGRMTGFGPVDKDRRAIWLKEHQPTSFNVGTPDKPFWVSYARIEPLATLLPVIADVVDASKYALDTGRADQLASQITFSIAKSLTDKAAIQGLSVLADFIDPDKISNPDFMQRNLLNTANAIIPHSSARRALSRAISGDMREINNELERAMITAMPFLAQALPPKIDRMTGKPMLHESGGFWNAISAVKISGPDVPEATKFLNRIAYKMDDEVRLGRDGVELDAKQRNFVDQKMFEWGLPKAIEDFAKTPWVQKELKEYEAGTKLRTIENLNSYKEVNAIMREARQFALDELFRTDPAYEAEVTKSRLSKQDYRRGVLNRTAEDYQNLINQPK